MYYPLSKSLKSFILFVAIFISTHLVGQDYQIIMSPIGPQTVFVGATINVYFSSFQYHENLDFSSPDMPSFATIVNDGKGYGRMVLEPEQADVGSYVITLNTIDGNGSNSQQFSLEVKGIPEDATIYYIDPINGDNANPGTSASPFKTLGQVLNTSGLNVEANTVFFLRSGNHGKVVFQEFRSDPVYVLAEAGNVPMLQKLSFSFTSNWYLSGLKISPEAKGSWEKYPYVSVFGGSEDISLTNCEIYASSDISTWTTNEDWYQYAGDGIISQGKNCYFNNNYIYNTWFPVQLKVRYSEFNYNIIDFFGADAMRGLASHQKFMYNQVKNAVVDDYETGNHDDGFQSWTFSAPIVDMVIKGNQITDVNNPDNLLKTRIMQGIVDFDGFAEDWVVEDNLMVMHHSHGIALYGAKNCKVTNNTIIKNPLKIFFPNDNPWIRINKHKDLRSSCGNLTRNNLMGRSWQDEYPGSFDHNYVAAANTTVFHDYNNWDFHLSNDANVIDQGIFDEGSTMDADQMLREEGELIDLGCFQKGANIRDFEKPSQPTNLTIEESSATYAKISWDASTDNIKLSHYIVLYGDNQKIVDQNSCWLTDLNPNSEYNIYIIAYDLASNKISSEKLYLETPVLETEIKMSSNIKDQRVNKENKLEWVGEKEFSIGGYTNGVKAVGIFGFRIPELPTKFVITEASISLFLNEVHGSPQGNVDLYGLGHSDDPDVSKANFYQGDYSAEVGNATGLIDDVFTPNSTTGMYNSDAVDTAVKDFILAQIEDGARAGDYVFFRLNSDLKAEQPENYYSIASGNNWSSAQIPVINLTVKNETQVEALGKDNLEIYPSLISDHQVLTIIVPNEIQNDIHIVITDVSGALVLEKKIENNTGTLEVNTDKMVSGMYLVKLKSNNKIWTAKVVSTK